MKGTMMFAYAELTVTNEGEPVLIIPEVPAGKLDVHLHDTGLEFKTGDKIIGHVTHIAETVVHWLSRLPHVSVLVFQDDKETPEEKTYLAKIYDKRPV